jgi:hypothetical protein
MLPGGGGRPTKNVGEWAVLFLLCVCVCVYASIRGGGQNNWNLNVAREVEVVARCAARCHESTQYSSSLSLGVDLG